MSASLELDAWKPHTGYHCYYLSVRIEYEPKAVGTYTVNVLFADQEIPTSPYKVKVEPDIDISGVQVVGMEPSKYHINLVGFMFFLGCFADCRGYYRH